MFADQAVITLKGEMMLGMRWEAALLLGILGLWAALAASYELIMIDVL